MAQGQLAESAVKGVKYIHAYVHIFRINVPLINATLFPVKLKVKSANVSLKYAIYFARNETLSFSPSYRQ